MASLTGRYNVLLDFPLILDVNRLIQGGPLIKYEDNKYARIGVMPRYGDAKSIQWFDVQPSSSFHIVNCFEDGDKVVMWACRALGSIIPGPDLGLNRFEYFSNGNKFAYTQIVDTDASSAAGMAKYGGLGKLCFEETGEETNKDLIKTEYHAFPDRTIVIQFTGSGSQLHFCHRKTQRTSNMKTEDKCAVKSVA
ncbi:hypothetical protein POM88_010438 [Heracleum sosnowskyi]|uniref:Dioxygenase n=1 Tax=Heracleum sosnowskyi TaxID=360622 RepID=A0AAD8N0I8_9APIA|nr:hypothetical protein POM88_010438 [Heracleum sosnowskyi]